MNCVLRDFDDMWLGCSIGEWLKDTYKNHFVWKAGEPNLILMCSSGLRRCTATHTCAILPWVCSRDSENVTLLTRLGLDTRKSPGISHEDWFHSRKYMSEHLQRRKRLRNNPHDDYEFELYYQDNANLKLHDFEKVQEQYENLVGHEQAQYYTVQGRYYHQSCSSSW